MDRWKLLKLKPFDNGPFNNHGLEITDEDFKSLATNNQADNVIAEDDMVRSYIMIDNHGNLLDNAGLKYSVVGNLLEESFLKLMERFDFNHRLYSQRY